MLSNDESVKKDFSLRFQVALIIFALLFISSSILIVAFHLLVTTRTFDNIVITQISDMKLGERVVNITKDIVMKNFWNSLLWVLIVNALIDIVISYVVSVWISRPVENLLVNLNNAYKRGIPYVNFTNNQYKEVEEISQVVSDMSNKYLDTLEMQNMFIQDISHELKTPLAAVKSTADLINMKPKADLEDYKYYYNTSNLMNQKLINLVNQLTMSSKSESEIYDPDDINLSILIKDIIKTYSSQVESKKIKLKFEIEKDIHIKGSAKYISVAISNIIDNAIKYSTKDNSNIYISLKRKRAFIILSIRDEGIGISEVDLKNIFNRFYRGENSQEINGTGLGLSITKKIIKSHRGKITVKSKLGIGTEIRIIFHQSL